MYFILVSDEYYEKIKQGTVINKGGVYKKVGISLRDNNYTLSKEKNEQMSFSAVLGQSS